MPDVLTHPSYTESVDHAERDRDCTTMKSEVGLRVLTWNLWGHGSPRSYFVDRGGEYRGVRPGSQAVEADDGIAVWRHRRELLASCIAAARPDIVCMQECLKPGPSNSAELAADLGFSVTDDSLAPGLAIATQLEIRTQEPLPLSADWSNGMPLHVVVRVASMDVSVVCLHMPLDRFGSRAQHVEELASWQSPNPVTLLAGDFNALPDGPEIARLLDAGYKDLGASSGPTMPNPDPVARIDYVLGRGIVCVNSVAVLGLEADPAGYLPSDHAGVAVDLGLAVSTAVPAD